MPLDHLHAFLHRYGRHVHHHRGHHGRHVHHHRGHHHRGRHGREHQRLLERLARYRFQRSPSDNAGQARILLERAEFAGRW